MNTNLDLAMQYVIDSGHRNYELVQQMVEDGADVNTRYTDSESETPLHHSVSDNDMVKFLIKLGADVNAQDQNGMIPLVWLCDRWDGCYYDAKTIKSVKAMIKAGADVNAVDKHGNTPLMYLYADYDEIEYEPYLLKIAQTMIKAGADVNARNKDGDTLFHITNRPKLIDLLIKAGADPGARNLKGELANHPQCVQAGLEATLTTANKEENSNTRRI